MKFFENKKTWKKIVIMFLIVMFFQLGFTTPVRAADDNDDGNFGIITGPIVSFIVAIGDRNQ